MVVNHPLTRHQKRRGAGAVAFSFIPLNFHEIAALKSSNHSRTMNLWIMMVGKNILFKFIRGQESLKAPRTLIVHPIAAEFVQAFWVFSCRLRTLSQENSPKARLLFIWWNWMMPSILATLVSGVWYSYWVWEKLTTSHTLPETHRLIRDDHLTCSAYSCHSAASSPWPSHPNFSSSFLLLSALNWFVQGKIMEHLQ